MNKLIKKISSWGLLMLAVGTLAMIAGCSKDKDDDSSTPAATPAASPFVGEWLMSPGSSPSSQVDLYLFIEPNNTFVMSNTNDKTHPHMTGTWSVTDNTFHGPFTNPNVGEGEIVCTINNNVMSIDFIEHWHDPYKHIAYAAQKA